MDVFDLPIVPAGSNPRDGLTILQARQRSALVVGSVGDARIIRAGELARAHRELPNILIGDGRLGSPILHVPSTSPSVDLLTNPQLGAPLLGTLRSRNVYFGLLRFEGDEAHVITSTEQVGRDLKLAISLCVCQNDPSHVWLPYELQGSMMCGWGDGQVTCS